MIGYEVRHNITNQQGKVTLINNKHLAVFWYNGLQGAIHAEKVREFGIPNCWNNKNDITIILNLKNIITFFKRSLTRVNGQRKQKIKKLLK